MKNLKTHNLTDYTCILGSKHRRRHGCRGGCKDHSLGADRHWGGHSLVLLWHQSPHHELYLKDLLLLPVEGAVWSLAVDQQLRACRLSFWISCPPQPYKLPTFTLKACLGATVPNSLSTPLERRFTPLLRVRTREVVLIKIPSFLYGACFAVGASAIKTFHQSSDLQIFHFFQIASFKAIYFSRYTLPSSVLKQNILARRAMFEIWRCQHWRGSNKTP